MKVRVHGPFAGIGPDGTVMGWGPGQVVEVSDMDEAAVVFYKRFVDIGAAELVDEPGPEPDNGTAAPLKRRGRPPLPRDAEGNIIRDDK